MPVPVADTHPSRAPMAVSEPIVMQSAGPFARLAAMRAENEARAAEATLASAAAAAAAAAGGREPDGNGAAAAVYTGPAVDVRGLTFSYPGLDGRPLPGIPPVITDMNLQLQPGSCCLLLGANGAGKTTLLKVLAGKHLIPQESVAVLGRPPFHDLPLTMSGELTYIGGQWTREVAFAGYSVPLQGDFPAGRMLDGVAGVDPARKARLLEVLDIDPRWRMHLVSDGQRRRVQIALGLLKPFKVLLLDEVTVDLDVLGRAEMLAFMKEECATRGATIIYATHIFDGLEGWASHVAYVARGRLQRLAAAADIPEMAPGGGGLLAHVEAWLRAENAAARDARAAAVAAGGGPEAGKFEYAWNNGWAAGRLTSSLAGSSNTVARM